MTLHPHCHTTCRRGADTTPCHLTGGCGTTWEPQCVLCDTKLEHGHTCQRCSDRLRKELNDILHLAAQAATHIDPSRSGSSGTRSVPSSRPPLHVDALDPELAIVRLIPGDPSTDLPVLVILEDWERVIRDDRQLAPYGIASEARLHSLGPLHGASYNQQSKATLTGVVRFLNEHHDWATTEPTFDLAEYARQVRLCRKAVARWDQDIREPAWRVPCPTITDDGECEAPLRVTRGAETVYCRACGREWEIPRLLAVAGRDADVWVDTEAAATLAGIHEHTLHKWIRRGFVAKRGQLVRIQDVRKHAQTLGA